MIYIDKKTNLNIKKKSFLINKWHHLKTFSDNKVVKIKEDNKRVNKKTYIKYQELRKQRLIKK